MDTTTQGPSTHPTRIGIVSRESVDTTTQGVHPPILGLFTVIVSRESADIATQDTGYIILRLSLDRYMAQLNQ